MTYVNHTIDDKYGDLSDTATTSIDYLREQWWQQGQGETCFGCPIGPPDDPSATLQSTWKINLNRNLQPDPAISITFNGTAIYIYGVVFAYSTTNLTFFVDGFPVSQQAIINQGQTNPIRGPQWQYNYLMYSNDTLNDGLHTLALLNHRDSLVMFDYAIYTASIVPEPEIPEPPVSQNTDDNDNSNNNNNNVALIAGIFGGIIAILLILALLIFLLRRKRRYNQNTIQQQEQQQPQFIDPPMLSQSNVSRFPLHSGYSAAPAPAPPPPTSATSTNASAGTSIITSPHPQLTSADSIRMGWNNDPNNNNSTPTPPAYIY